MLILARHMRRTGAAALATVLLAAGCSGPFPADSEDSLTRVSGGTLHIGATANSPWTEIEPDGDVTGVEAALVVGYAESIDAEIDWIDGSESVLANKMNNGELDIVIGGITSQSPWAGKIALTRPYSTVRGEDGKKDQMVMGVRPGENALLVSLETFLAEQGGEV